MYISVNKIHTRHPIYLQILTSVRARERNYHSIYPSIDLLISISICKILTRHLIHMKILTSLRASERDYLSIYRSIDLYLYL